MLLCSLEGAGTRGVYARLFPWDNASFPFLTCGFAFGDLQEAARATPRATPTGSSEPVMGRPTTR